MSTEDNLSPTEQQAYEVITSHDEITQSELWKELDTTSRTGSRVASSLAEKGLIKREETTLNGQRTYRLVPINEAAPSTDDSDDESADEQATTDTGQGEHAASDTKPGNSVTTEEVLRLVRERGGIPQSELWKELDIDSRAASRLVAELVETGQLRRDEITYQGTRTYLLQPAKRDLDFSLLMAGNEMAPTVSSDDDFDPISSAEFTEWIMYLTREHRRDY